jgi:hypothetical protein
MVLVAGESGAETGVGAGGEVDRGAGECAGWQETGVGVGAGGPGVVCGDGAGAWATGGERTEVAGPDEVGGVGIPGWSVIRGGFGGAGGEAVGFSVAWSGEK